MLFYYTMDDAVCNHENSENPEKTPDSPVLPGALTGTLPAVSSADLPKGRSLLLAVLIPHPNAAAVLWGYKRALFQAGDEGAYAFPPAVPLGVLKRPLDRESLRALARAVRDGSLEGGGNGRISAPHWGDQVNWKTGLTLGLNLYGPELDLPLDWQCPDDAAPLQPLILPLTIRRLSNNSISSAHSPFHAPPAPINFFFTAAYVAVMKLRPLDSGVPGLSYAWRFGEVRWLPGVKSEG